MAVEDALGFEVLLRAAQFEIGEGLLLAQEDVFGAEGEAELHEPGADDDEERNERPRDESGGAPARRGSGGRGHGERRSEHGEADEAEHDHAGEDREDAGFELGDREGHFSSGGER